MKVKISDDCFRVGIVNKLVDVDRVDVTLLTGLDRDIKQAFIIYKTGLGSSLFELAAVVGQRFLQRRILRLRL